MNLSAVDHKLVRRKPFHFFLSTVGIDPVAISSNGEQEKNHYGADKKIISTRIKVSY